MAGGGAERVVSILLNNLSRENREFFLIVLEDKFYYDLPYDVKVFKLFKNLESNSQKFLVLFSGARFLKKIVQENNIDIVVSFLGRSNYINIMAKSAGHKAYISERVDPSQMHSFGGTGIINKIFTKRLYKKADLIFTNSLGTKESLSRDFGVDSNKIKVIYNLIDLEKIQNLCHNNLEPEYQEIFKHPVIINIGRLTKQKGQEYLIRAFKQIREREGNGGLTPASLRGSDPRQAKLVILGEGELEKDLKNLTEKLGLENDVFFLGWQKNPFRFLSRAKVFVLSSLWEGLPNTLIEALACGCPAVSTDCPSGPNEIIDNEKNGFLIPVKDEKALSQAIIKILRNPDLANQFSRGGEKKARDFSIENIINQYERIIQ